LHAILVLLAESSIAAEPSERALHNPGESGDLEGSLLPFEDLQLPTLVSQDLPGELPTGVTGIGHHRVNPGKQRAQPSHQTGSGAFIGHVRWLRPVAIGSPNVSTRNVAFAPFDALVSVETAHAAALGGLYRLTIHDHHAWACFPPDGYTSLLI
jgi:hypothetical protein